MAIITRLITFYVPTRFLLTAMNWVWQRTGLRITSFISEKFRILAAAIGTLAVILVGTFATPNYAGSSKAD
jgi:CNT family concentrative nucleoside transporter